MSSRSVVALPLVASALFVSAVHAQCATDWVPGNPPQSPLGEVGASVMYDPDGAGPLTPRLVVGGYIFGAGNVTTRGVVAWDPSSQQWQALGGGLRGSVRAFAVMPNNDLLAAGYFDVESAAGVWFNASVARWDGIAWQPMGIAFSGVVSALVVRPNGHAVVAGNGSFYSPFTGLVVGEYAVEWDGANWSAMPGLPWPPACATVLASGNVVIGSYAGGAASLSEWNGVAWVPFAPGVSAASALVTMQGGDLVAAGEWVSGLGFGVHRWNGASWQLLGAADNEVFTLSLLPNGDLVAGGTFTQIAGVAVGGLARWDGVAWHAIGTGPGGNVLTVTPSSTGELYAGGSWLRSMFSLVQWDGMAWSPVRDGVAVAIVAATEAANGDLIAAGRSWIGGVADESGIVRWNGTVWSRLASLNGPVTDIVELPSGDIVVCGSFTLAGGLPVQGLARWDGTSWSSMNWPLPQFSSGAVVLSLAVAPNGDLLVGGSFSTVSGIGAPRNVARWDGTSWSSVGIGPTGEVRDVVALPNGDVVVGGVFTVVDQPWFLVGGNLALRIARFDGTAWMPLGSGMNSNVSSLLVAANGDVIATGPFTQAGGVPVYHAARWNGSTWSPLGSSPGSKVVAELPNGDLLCSGAGLLAKWDGATWSSMPLSDVKSATMLRKGELWIGGDLTIAGFAPSGHALLATNCPASVAPFGPGCASSGGGNELVAETFAWSAGALRSRGAGLPASAFAIVATGFQAAPVPVPLANFLPAAGAGCELHVVPDILQFESAIGGVVRSSLTIPASPSIVGGAFFQQMVVLEHQPGLGVVASTATNALRLVVGAF